MTFYESKDGSFIVNEEYNSYAMANEYEDTPEVIRLTDKTVEQVELKRPDDVCDGFNDIIENRIEHLFNTRHRYRNLENLHQYQFDRGEMTRIFEEVFPLKSVKWDWDDVWWCNFSDTNSFHAFKDNDEYYILHKPSGTMINWYKHMGRTNTCNKDLSPTELKLFLLLLRKELVEERIIKPDADDGSVGIVKDQDGGIKYD